MVVKEKRQKAMRTPWYHQSKIAPELGVQS